MLATVLKRDLTQIESKEKIVSTKVKYEEKKLRISIRTQSTSIKGSCSNMYGYWSKFIRETK